VEAVKMILSILVPTTIERSKVFNRLLHEIKRQIKPFKKQIEILSLCDNKEMTIGEKRNKLYQMAKGKYSWQIDDDDWIHPDAIEKIMKAVENDSDCITFSEVVIFDGKRLENSNFSLKYVDWADNQDGYNHVRIPFFKTPIKTEICRLVAVKDIRFAEDHEFARSINPLLKTETHIDDYLYWYLHYSTPFNERYGIVRN
jgi:glycosyltransferase involved in cell wall biosynthesis